MKRSILFAAAIALAPAVSIAQGSFPTTPAAPTLKDVVKQLQDLNDKVDALTKALAAQASATQGKLDQIKSTIPNAKGAVFISGTRLPLFRCAVEHAVTGIQACADAGNTYCAILGYQRGFPVGHYLVREANPSGIGLAPPLIIEGASLLDVVDAVCTN